MPRPTNKTDLLAEIRKEKDALEALIAALSESERIQPGVCGAGKWSVKDLLAHLAEWSRMGLGWYATGLQGAQPEMPAPGYNWRQLPALNHYIWEKYRDTSWKSVRHLFDKSHADMLALIESLSDQQIFRVGEYAWTRKLALASYLIPNTTSHYRWASKHIKDWNRKRGAAPVRTAKAKAVARR